MKKPNIVLIMTDQQRWDTLSCYGNSVIETPNIDWIASEGTVFRHAYTASPSCIPARASILSGMKPWNTGILGMGRGQGTLTGGFEHTLPGELAKAGYHTQAVGKMHFHPQRSLHGFHNTVLDEDGRSIDPGFISDYNRWFDNNKTGNYGMVDHGIDWNSWMARPFHAPEFLHPSNWTINESIRFLQERDPNKPFFLMTSFCRPHSPYDPPSYYFDLYKNKQLPEPSIGEWSSMHDVPKDAASHNTWRGKRSNEEIHRARAGYYGAINHIDHQIGRMLHYLNKEKLMENTMIIFTSDHGDMLGDHHLWRKTYAYEGSAHIPMIVRLPKSFGKPKFARLEQVVALYDLMPTILETAGVSVPCSVDGSSMLKIMQDQNASWREFLHGEHSTCYSEEQEMQYVTDGTFKYIWFPRLGTEQLFNLDADPGELHDLAGREEYRPELERWRSRMIAELEPRAAGLTDGERLVCQAGQPYLVSPKYRERVERVGVSGY